MKKNVKSWESPRTIRHSVKTKIKSGVIETTFAEGFVFTTGGLTINFEGCDGNCYTQRPLTQYVSSGNSGTPPTCAVPIGDFPVSPATLCS